LRDIGHLYLHSIEIQPGTKEFLNESERNLKQHGQTPSSGKTNFPKWHVFSGNQMEIETFHSSSALLYDFSSE